MDTMIVEQNQLDETAVNAFAAKFSGPIITPGHPEYDDARGVWNGMIDRRPALIARPRSEADVIAAVNFARAHSLIVSVRGGGHNVAGHAMNDDGMVIDLSLMNQVTVEVQTHTVSAQGGATIKDLDAATQPHGLAVPMGVVSATGIAGLTLGGGMGWLRNKFGLSADNLIAADVVTADGRFIHAGENENSDLLWGLRGGGGNFGIVTRFVYQAHPVGSDVWFTFVFHDARGDNMKRAIRLYRDFSETAPDEVSTLLFTGIVPPDEAHFPAEIHNVPFVTFAGMYAGAPADGERVMQPLHDFGRPLLDFSGVMPYVEAQQALDADYPDGLRYYWKSLNLSRLDDDVIDRIVRHARKQVSVLSTVDLWHVGGAVKQFGAEHGAFNGRHAAFLLSPEANWEDPANDEANIAWLREFVADMEEFSDGSRYLNFPGFQEEGDQMIKKSFGSQYGRLAALKQKYDPDNFFRLNQNVKPAP